MIPHNLREYGSGRGLSQNEADSLNSEANGSLFRCRYVSGYYCPSYSCMRLQCACRYPLEGQATAATLKEVERSDWTQGLTSGGHMQQRRSTTDKLVFYSVNGHVRHQQISGCDDGEYGPDSLLQPTPENHSYLSRRFYIDLA